MEKKSIIKKQYPTIAQKTRLVALLEADDELRQGKFSAVFTKKESEARWRTMSEELNSIPGAKKEWIEWRKCWQDMKSKCKKKNSELRRCQNGTGGGPPAPSLTPEEEEILRTISQPVLTGHADSQESLVDFKDLISLPKPGKPVLPLSIDEPLQQENAKILILPDPAAQPPLTSTPQPTTNNHHVNPLGEKEGAEVQKIFGAQTSDRVHIPEEINNASNTKENRRKSRVTRPQKRLEKSMDIALQFKDAVIAKNSIKKTFYEQYILEMRKQTEALQMIANNLNHT